jgi:adenylate cyclase
VHGNLDIAFVDVGERQVKNIARPIRVFAIALDTASVPRSLVPSSGGLAPRAEPASPPGDTPAMSVGVISLLAPSSDAAAIQQADSMTRELTAMLTRAATILRVIPVPPARAAAARPGSSRRARAPAGATAGRSR